MQRLAFVTLALSGCAPSAETPRAAPPTSATVAIPRNSSAIVSDVPPPPRTHPGERPSAERTANEAPPTHIDENGCRIPWDFIAADLLATVDPDPASRKASTARILTWLVEVDERPLLIDRALLWIHAHPTSQSDSWQLVHLYRHPLDDSKQWHVAVVYDVPYVGQQVYSSQPRARELDAFLRDTWWTFEASDEFRLLDAGVCSDAWATSIGSVPNHQYRVVR